MAGDSVSKRGGARRGARPRRRFEPKAAALAAGITLCLIAWGLLVWAAIDFGAAARSGESVGWLFLALCSVGAIACLFLGLMLVAALSRTLGLTSPPPADSQPAEARAPGPVAGRRAAR